MTDASRAVPVVQKLLAAIATASSPKRKADQDAARESYLAGQDKRPRLPLAQSARARAEA